MFVETKAVKNVFINDDYIPKLGTDLDVSIYKKVIKNDVAIIDLLTSGERALFVNMRATFWIKAFMKNHSSKEYKVFMCNDDEIKAYCMCLLNSSLFWWFWISVSDCWHITNKELNTFMVPKIIKYEKYVKLAKSLEEKLEETKEYVGTIQTDYEYKHKFCVDEIVNIDNEIANTFKLTDEENIYIKNFAYKYRIGGGAFYGCN